MQPHPNNFSIGSQNIQNQMERGFLNEDSINLQSSNVFSYNKNSQFLAHMDKLRQKMKSMKEETQLLDSSKFIYKRYREIQRPKPSYSKSEENNEI